MVPMLTLSLVVLGAGLTLLILAFARRKATGEQSDLPVEAPNARRIRPVPLALGLLLAIAGGVGAGVILSGDPETYDHKVLAMWPADWLVTDLNHDDSKRRSDAYHELTRRYEAGTLPDDAHRRLVARRMAWFTADYKAPEAPKPQYPVVEVDIVKARNLNLLSADVWASYVARRFPMRLDVPQRAEAGQPIAFRLDASLDDPMAPAWVIVKVESLKISDKALDPPPPVAVARNPDWTMPPPAIVEAGGGGSMLGPVERPPVLRRVVRYPYNVPAELVSAMGEGEFPVVAEFTIYAFDSAKTAPPTELMNDAATGVPRRQRAEEDLQAAVLSAQLTAEQFEQLRPKADGSHKWSLKRQIRIGNPPPASQPSDGAEQPDQDPTDQ